MHRFGAAAVVVVILFMAIIIWLSKIVQAAPFVNRLLEKRKKKREARRIFNRGFSSAYCSYARQR